MSAALFSGAHLPNWFLMLVTLVFGYVCTRIFMRQRIYFLGPAHAALGLLCFGSSGFHQPSLDCGSGIGHCGNLI